MYARVGFFGIKGGVGKSTISIYVAMKLAKKYKVIYIDKDYMGWPSYKIGLKGPGYHRALYENLDESAYFFENGNISAFKFLGSPVTDKEIHRKLGKDHMEKYIKILERRKFDFAIIDYGGNQDPTEDISYEENEAFSIVYPGVPRYGIGVSDPFQDDIIKTVTYSQEMTSKIGGTQLAIAINMVPPLPDEMEYARMLASSIEKKTDFKFFVIPFIDRLFRYSNFNQKFREDLSIKELDGIVDLVEKLSQN